MHAPALSAHPTLSSHPQGRTEKTNKAMLRKTATVLLLALCLDTASAKLVTLRELGPRLEFLNGRAVQAYGKPGEGMVEVDSFECQGHNCEHLRLTGANCTHDPAQLDDSIQIVWACEEDQAVQTERPPLHSHHHATFLFSPVSVVCDSNLSVGKGLLWTPVDTAAISVPGDVLPSSADQIYVDPATCRLVYTVENLGCEDEHLTLALLVLSSVLFAFVAICPGALKWILEYVLRWG